MQESKFNLRPVGKYVNDEGKEGVRYIWEIDGTSDYYVESGAFYKRTNLGINKIDEQIAAYTTSVSSGCFLSKNKRQCKFCVTGNTIPFRRFLTGEEIALQNIFMVLDDKQANELGKMREFAYMGQGEPGFSYEQVKQAMIITNAVMEELGIRVFRHIFATSGVTPGIEKLTKDVVTGVYGKNKILLHLSIHAAIDRGKLMPINEDFPLAEVIKASEEYARLTGEKVVVNFMMLSGAVFGNDGPFSTLSAKEINCLVKLLNPNYHRIILCEYNPPGDIDNGNSVSVEEINQAERQFLDHGFTVKKFIAFGKKDKLACGLLGGRAIPNLSFSNIKNKFERACNLISNLSQ
jgi:adenine C2-methylase RlmN of 23S rRNA A2503 and tRNA A37